MTFNGSIIEERRPEPRVYHITHRNLVASLGAALIGVIVIVFAAYYFGKRNERVALEHLGNAVVIQKAQSVAPPVEHATPPVNPNEGFTRYVVDPHDTISDLCNDHYNDGSYAAFTAAGKEIHGLRNPNDLGSIFVGQVLWFPPFIVVNGTVLRANSIARSHERWLRRQGRPYHRKRMVSRLIFNTTVEITERVPIITMPNETDLPISSRTLDPIGGTDVTLAKSDAPIQMPEPRQPNTEYNSGYRIIIPASRAKTMLISDRALKKELEACVITLDGRQDCSFIALAQKRKRGDIVLFVSVKEFPRQPFTMVVANRGKPIRIESSDGLIASATPIRGHFPRPSRFKTDLLMAKDIAVRGGIGFLVGGPIGGATAAFAPPVARTIVGHFIREDNK